MILVHSLWERTQACLAEGLAHSDNAAFIVLYLLETFQGVVAGGTFKVDQAVPVEVHVVEDLIHIPLAEALPQQGLEGCPELTQADAAIPVGVELWQRWSWSWVTNWIMHSLSPSLTADTQALPALSPSGRTSRKASRSSLTPIMSAVSASSLGPISSTKSSKSTFPPPGGGHVHQRPLASPGPPLLSALSFWLVSPLPCCTTCALCSLWAPRAGPSVFFDGFP